MLKKREVLHLKFYWNICRVRVKKKNYLWEGGDGSCSLDDEKSVLHRPRELKLSELTVFQKHDREKKRLAIPFHHVLEKSPTLHVYSLTFQFIFCKFYPIFMATKLLIIPMSTGFMF